jgi:hypothetical protein
MLLAALGSAEPSGLSGAIERQRQDIEAQRGATRREIERQGRTLQQQQDQNLQFQLQLRQQQPVSPPLRPGCVQVDGRLFRQ